MFTNAKVIEAQDLFKRDDTVQSLIPIIIDDHIHTPWPAAMPSEQIAADLTIQTLLANIAGFMSIDIPETSNRIETVTQSLSDLQTSIQNTQALIEKTKSMISSASSSLAYSVYSGTPATSIAKGTGTQADPFIIQTAEEFAFAFAPSNSNADMKYYVLEADLDFTENYFTGKMSSQNLDGNKKTIKIAGFITNSWFLELATSDSTIKNLYLNGFVKVTTDATLFKAPDSLSAAPQLNYIIVNTDLVGTNKVSVFDGVSVNNGFSYGLLLGKDVTLCRQGINQANMSLVGVTNFGIVQGVSSDFTLCSGIVTNEKTSDGLVVTNCNNYARIYVVDNAQSKAAEVVLGTNAAVTNSYGFSSYYSTMYGKSTEWVYGFQVMEFSTSETINFVKPYDLYSKQVRKVCFVNTSDSSITLTLNMSQQITVELGANSSQWFYLIKSDTQIYAKRIFTSAELDSEFTKEKFYTGVVKQPTLGDGSKENPYIVRTADEFAYLNTSSPANSTDRKYYQIVNDLDFYGKEFSLNVENCEINLNGNSILNIKFDGLIGKWSLTNVVLCCGRVQFSADEQIDYTVMDTVQCNLLLLTLNFNFVGVNSFIGINDDASTFNNVTFEGSVSAAGSVSLLNKKTSVVETISNLKNYASLSGTLVSVYNRFNSSVVDVLDNVINFGVLNGTSESLVIKENPVVSYGTYSFQDHYQRNKVEKLNSDYFTLSGTQFIDSEVTELNLRGAVARYIAYPINMYLLNGTSVRTVVLKVRGTEIPIYQQNGTQFNLTTQVGVGYTKYTLWFNQNMTAAYTYKY